MEFYNSNSKKSMKNFKRIIGMLLAGTLACTALAGCGKDKQSSDEVSFYFVGSAQPDTAVVMEKINEKLKAEIGLTIKYKFLTTDNYDLVIQSGEKYDLVAAPDWLNYWANAEKGAFAEITEDELKEYAPYIYENDLNRIKAAKYEGKIYAIPGMNEYSADRCFMVRGDLMDKYGIETINNMADVEKYLDAVKKNEPDIIPFDMSGSSPYMLFAMFASDWGWCSPGSGSFGDHVYFDVKDPERKLFIAAERPETKEFTETMKRWMDNGYFSKSILSNKTSAENSFKNGRSAFAYTSSPETCNTIWNEFQQDDRKSWDVRFYPMYNECQTMYNWLNAATAISAFSDNKENALKVLNTMYENEEIYKLFLYGIEGTHYKELGNGLKESLDSESYVSPVSGIVNMNYALSDELQFPGAYELVDKLHATRFWEVTVNCNMDYSDLRETKLAMSEVYKNYTTPRTYGVVDDVDKALKEEVAELKKAGIDDYIVKVQQRLNDYVAAVEK